jgi:Sulfotransferase family
MLPSFVVIGAMKSGTTSLYHYLKEHPQVFMARTKEPNFFTEEHNWRRGVAWYEHLFDEASDDVRAVGEASTNYSKYPEFRGVPERIASVIPGVRLVYSVRDPIERMRSHYLHRLARGKEQEPIDVALLSNPTYVDTSRYALQIERYLEQVSMDQILVIRAEELQSDRSSTMRRIYRFIGVEEGWMPPSLDEEFYRTADKPSFSPLLASWRSARAWPTVRRLVPRSVRELVRRSAAKGATPSRIPPLSADARRRLEDLLREDVRRLMKLLGDGFDGWGLA